MSYFDSFNYTYLLFNILEIINKLVKFIEDVLSSFYQQLCCIYETGDIRRDPIEIHFYNF